MQKNIYKNEVSKVKFIPGTNNKFAVTSDGNIISYLNNPEGYILTPRNNGSGYEFVTIKYTDGTLRHEYVHRLVAKAFLDNPNNLQEIDHINTDKSDNRAENLRWVTHYENMHNPLTVKKLKEVSRKKRNSGLSINIYGDLHIHLSTNI